MSDTGKIAEALAAFQAEMPVVAKAHTAKVPTKTGGSYSYTYAGLADVSAAAMPILAKHGLSFSACPGLTERGFELRGMLLHTSGETLTGSLPIAGNTPQEMGSSLTYMRRYLLGCMTGIVTDDDDDGRAAQGVAKKPRAARAAPPPTSEDRPPVAPSGDGITPAQLGKLGAMMSELGIRERAEALGYVKTVLGIDVESRNDLSRAQASKVIEALAADLDRIGSGACGSGQTPVRQC